MLNRVVLFFTLLLPLAAFSDERILHFRSDITVHKNASLTVHETIRVRSEQEAIRHGIMREFPTKYKDGYANNYAVTFNFKRALLDGATVEVKQESRANGVVLYLGDPNTYVAKGVHTYEIVYETDRQMGFFADFDELYWNVTGNGWRFAIDKAEAKILLPAKVPESSLRIDAYTGYFGEKGKNFTKRFTRAPGSDDVTAVEFTSTKALASYEGLTVAVGWPKGIVDEPTAIQKSGRFLKDNIGVEILLIAIALVLMIYIPARRRVRKSNQPGTIIPLFRPPTGMLPSEMRYMRRRGYDAQALASEVVNLAVNGFLTIESKGETYSVARTNKASEGLPDIQREILDQLFASGQTQHDFEEDEDEILVQLSEDVSSLLSTKWGQHFGIEGGAILSAIFVTCIAALAAFLLQRTIGAAFVIGISALVVVNLVYAFRLKYYTQKGRRVMDEIDGFKLFLATTETDRLKVIGTPPTRTPELYEKYLPYAIALDVEEQWSKQFAPVFEALERQNTPYLPLWYVGVMHPRFDSGTFSKSLASSFSSAISSSSSSPGSSSGSGGGGSSGGGGGGGGGGGW